MTFKGASLFRKVPSLTLYSICTILKTNVLPKNMFPIAGDFAVAYMICKVGTTQDRKMTI